MFHEIAKISILGSVMLKFDLVNGEEVIVELLSTLAREWLDKIASLA